MSEAECAFTTVARGLTAEGRPDELGLPTFPARRFVSAGGLTVVHDGVVEYELVDIDGAAERGQVATALAAHAWPSPCCGPPACSPGWAWPTDRSPPAR